MQNKDSKRHTSVKRQVKQIVWLLLLVTILMLFLSYFQVQTMSAVGAYVRGEGLWAKAQKDAVMLLRDYVQQPDEATYTAFLDTLELNLADESARLALQQQPPDLEAAKKGLLKGGNHSDDIDSMIQLFLRFGDVHHMKEAIIIWAEADRKIDHLLQLASRIYETHQRSPRKSLLHFNTQLSQINAVLSEQETAFSTSLNEGARWMKDTFMIMNFSLLVTLLLVVGFIARRIVVNIENTDSELRHSESRFNALYEANVIGILVWGDNGELHDANDEFLNTLGYDRSELESGELNWLDLTPAESAKADKLAMQQIAEKGYCTPFNKEFIHKQGYKVPVFVGGALMDGSTNKGVAFMVDRSSDKKMQDQLLLSATVLEASRDGIVICDYERKVLTANDAFYNMTGLDQASLLGQPASLLRADSDQESQQIETVLQSNGYWQGDVELDVVNDGILPVRISLSTVTSAQGNVSHYVAVYTDISERKAMEQELQTLAHYDHLTGLANRSLCTDRLDRAITRAQRQQQQCAILFIDLDKFKPVNDQYGHANGDRLLCLVAQRLLSITRKSDTVGRLGGDEFVIIIEGLSQAEWVTSIADKAVEQLHQPFTLDTNTVVIGCSIGIAVYPMHGENSAELLRAADQSMYEAKGAGGSRFEVYRHSF